ncbi:MAG: hypothetical protein WD534_12870 [Phycisphaeraceae bacterium]
MNASFEELDYQQTPLGELILRRRESVSLPSTVVYEVKLNGEFLMSSLVNASEKAMADLALAPLNDESCDVLIGGLGLGYTAATALTHKNVRRVDVIEYIQPVIDWHRNRVVPLADQLMDDPRCKLIRDDFFDYVEKEPAEDQSRYDVVLVDIDHSPEALLDSRHGRFYTREGLRHLKTHLRPGGIFGLWSADPPPRLLLDLLNEAFVSVHSHNIKFYNSLLHVHDANTIVVAQLPSKDGATSA